MLITQEPVFQRFWYPVAFASAVSPGPTARRLLGQDVVLWSTPDGVKAAVDRCPHREAKLSAGWVDDRCRLVCPYHGWEYAPDGRAVRIPQLSADVPIPPGQCWRRCDARCATDWSGCVSTPSPSGRSPRFPSSTDPVGGSSPSTSGCSTARRPT